MQRGWHLRNRCQQRGIGFIEILITIALLSIGFLALARMQVEGMRFSQSAYFQSQAYFLASDMINRMRTNTDGVRDGHYDNIVTSADAQDQQCNTTDCNPKQIALQDVFEWGEYFHVSDNSNDLVPALPSSDNVTASATVVPLNDDVFSVRIVWSEIVRGEDIEQSLSVNFALSQESL